MEQRVKLRSNILILGLFLLFFPVSVFPQTADIVTKAQEAYEKESFEKAYEIVDKGIPESADPALKSQASSFLTTIGIAEYNAKNWKNASDAFRKALKYQPTNSLATQYFLKIRTEKGIVNLKNEGEPRVKESPAEKPSGPGGPPVVAQPPTQATTLPSYTVSPPVTSVVSPVLPQPTIELEEVKKALELTSSQLKAVEQSVSSTTRENEILKAQLDQQLKIIQSFMEQQTKVPPSPERNEEEKQIIAKTMEVLAKLSVQEPKAPQVVLQQDPEMKTLVQQLAAMRDRTETPWLTYSNIIALGFLSLGVLVLATFVIILTRRIRSRIVHKPAHPMDSSVNTLSAGYTSQLTDQRTGSLPLLGFMGTEGTANAQTVNLGLLKELIHMDRMIRMVEEMRNGRLSWDMVRENLGELEVSLKTEILKVVEKKIAEGDLLTSEAVLPILFPFLNDFDDYIREKSNLLARKALLADKNLLPSTEESDGSPLSLKNLLQIPKQLSELLRGLDESLVTAKLSRSIATILGLSRDECNLLYKTAVAHDCGYLLLDRDRLQSIISKPEISEEEFEFIKQHTRKGLEYFQNLDLPTQFKEGILYHHERNDGSGYPEGLRKAQIPLFAKIIGAAETFATLIAKRPYRSKRDVLQALAILEDTARTKFDLNIIQALIQAASNIGR